MPGSVEVDLSQQAKNLLKQFPGRASKVTSELKTVIDKLSAWVMREMLKAFPDQKQPGGEAWDQNGGMYALVKLAEQGQSRAGYLSGALARSISRQVLDGGLAARVSSPLEYAGAFNNGQILPLVIQMQLNGQSIQVRTAGGPSPARPFMPEEGYLKRETKKLTTALMKDIKARLEGKK